ncbi:alpha/beta hydrolase [Ramlibacter sp. USB13]|uniref:Alpha/beta hydrolase n=1 Tax=Ramlibacter cellulosilyticus TaxID=2764187 RepID=A0A923MTA7_9BURK|nr:alpha/beta hydrolase [Ramlibacter cellulosilyticus]MBC5784383.1 alpha/beta hydrolase [Ramlibacter cellulosilyticus]
MARIATDTVTMSCVEHGSGDNVVLAVHGNLGCANWLDLVLPLLPPGLRVIAAEWRGCGDSDKPAPAADHSNYSMAVHARDHLALLDALGIRKCHLYGHSTGGIIASHMLAMAPDRFGKVLLLDPVTPLGLQLAPGQVDVLTAMKNDKDVCFAGLASAAPTLFRPETLAAGQVPQFAGTASAAQRAVFRLLVEKTRLLSDGVWFGTPHNLALEWASGALAEKMPKMLQEHLVLYGAMDWWIPREHMDVMVQKLPKARLELFPSIGHSMNLEQPSLFARIFSDWFRG